MDPVDNFTVLDLASKWRSKTEIYNLLSREGKIYLPPKQEATQVFLRDLMMGKKKYITCEEVKCIKVPQYNGLTVKNIHDFAQRNFHVERFLPEYDYLKEPNREWLCNLVNSIIPEKFQKFIETKVEERRQLLINSQNLGISVQPDILNIFKQSKAISTVKGKSHFLTRLPKPTKDKLKIQQLVEERKELNIRDKDVEKELVELKIKLQNLEKDQIINDENAEKLNRLYQLGLINDKGEPINNDMS